jgi:hypothetical protein
VRYSYTTPISQTLDDVTRQYGPNWPDYKQRLKTGKLATTRQSVYGETVEYAPGYGSATYLSGAPNTVDYAIAEGKVTPTIAIDGNIDDVSTSKATSRALSAITSAVRDELTSFNGGNFLGEIAETIRMIKSPAKALRRGVDKYVHAARRNARGRLKAADQRRILSDTWLEHSFGWRPLIADLDDLSSTLASRSLEPEPFSIVKRSAVDEESSIGTKRITLACGVRGEYDEVTTTRAIRKFKACVKLSLPNQGLRKWGLSPDTFVPTAWELIPYSFMVDYFTNVGDVINAWSLPTGSVRWVETVLVREQSVSHQGGRFLPLSEDWVGTFYVGTYRVTRRSVYRDQWTASLVPDFRFELPGRNSQWLNIGALAGSRRL